MLLLLLRLLLLLLLLLLVPGSLVVLVLHLLVIIGVALVVLVLFVVVLVVVIVPLGRDDGRTSKLLNQRGCLNDSWPHTGAHVCPKYLVVCVLDLFVDCRLVVLPCGAVAGLDPRSVCVRAVHAPPNNANTNVHSMVAKELDTNRVLLWCASLADEHVLLGHSLGSKQVNQQACRVVGAWVGGLRRLPWQARSGTRPVSPKRLR